MYDRTQIGSLVGVRPLPTVVRLEGLDGPGASWITESYCVTADVEAHLRSLASLLARPAGTGIFVIGPYGSGKSHFLGYVYRELAAGRLGDPAPRPFVLSLLNVAADVRLEDAVSRVLGVEAAGDIDRRAGIARLLAAHPQGVFLLIDEVSEFLRSKPDRRQLAEDIRYLQFLGEQCKAHRLFVVAAAQEQVEHLGILDQSQYRKIKDRYPIRYLLTPSHTRDIVSRSVLLKQPGYGPEVERLAERLHEALGKDAIDPGALADLYPLHPLTFQLLDEIRDCFSQARGAVDFVVTQLAGDPARHVAPFLDRPWGEMVTPDRIVDHFRDQFELQPELQPLSRVYLPHHEERIPQLFENEAQRELALRAVKLLALYHVAPGREGVTAAEAAVALTVTPSRLDPKQNVSAVARILDRLASQGRYLREERGRYAVDLADDGQQGLERLLEREMAELSERGASIFEDIEQVLGKGAPAGFNPFTLPRGRWQARTVTWSHHDRAYAVWLGDDPPPQSDALGLVLRLPWGAGAPAPGVFTIVPETLAASAEVMELAALHRLAKRTLPREVRARITERLAKRRELVLAQVAIAYAKATLTGPKGEALDGRSASPRDSLDAWLDVQALVCLRRTFPAFESYAPTCGTLGLYHYRELARFGLAHDIGAEQAPEVVRVVREGYLVPMKLLKHRGQGYSSDGFERHELVKVVASMAQHRPEPAVVYERLAMPPHGLVADQIHLLLLTMLLHGEIDVRKGSRSYRDLFETLPTPDRYERIVPGDMLKAEEVHALEELCVAFSVAMPRTVTLVGHRRALQDIARLVEREVEALEAFRRRLGDGSPALARDVEALQADLRRLATPDPLEGLRGFLRESSGVRSLLRRRAEIGALPGRLEKMLAERDRLVHLAGHPGIARCDTEAARAVRAAGPPPAESYGQDLELWIDETRRLYELHASDYRERHDAYWNDVRTDPLLEWAPPAVASSVHLGLEPVLAKLREVQGEVRRLACLRLSNLEFQPACACGFDGAGSPCDGPRRTLRELRDRIEGDLARFFAQASVREKLQTWEADRLEPGAGARAYLEGRAPYPSAQNVPLLDKHLAGLSLVRTVDAGELLDLLASRTWDRKELEAALARHLAALPGVRLRFERSRAASVSGEVARFCLEHALRAGARLPAGLQAELLEEAASALAADWVPVGTLERLDDLGLPEAVVTRILRLVAAGSVPCPPTAGPLAGAARELFAPSSPSSPQELAAISWRCYRHHSRLLRVDATRWRERLDILAAAPVPDLPPIDAVLGSHPQAAWVMLDAMGLPFLPTLERILPGLLPRHRVASRTFALAPETTTTEAFYDALAQAGIAHAVEKVDAADRLLHERFLDLGDLAELVAAESAVAFRRLAPGLAGEVVLFADHGFRIAPDGGSYRHGGASALERVVPVFHMVPA